MTTQEQICKLLPTVIKPTAKKWLTKELVKAKIATQFIGEGAVGSSTDRYEKLYSQFDLANTGKYNKNDIIWISSNGKRNNRISPVYNGNLQGVYNLIILAIKAESMFIMDTKKHLENTKWYNIGELQLATFLENNGYQRQDDSGIWEKFNLNNENT